LRQRSAPSRPPTPAEEWCPPLPPRPTPGPPFLGGFFFFEERGGLFSQNRGGRSPDDEPAAEPTGPTASHSRPTPARSGSPISPDSNRPRPDPAPEPGQAPSHKEFNLPLTTPGTKPPSRQAKDEPYNIYPDVQYIGEFLTKDLAGEVYSFYFGSGSWILGPRQEQVLREYVVPMLNMTGSLVEIYALSDRSGSKKSNYELSQHRLG